MFKIKSAAFELEAVNSTCHPDHFFPPPSGTPALMVTPDSSITPEYGIELKPSRPLSIKETKTALKRAIRHLKNNDCYINSTCGLHFHLCFPYSQLVLFTSLDFVFYFQRKLKEYAEKQLDGRLLARFNNNYCQPIKDLADLTANIAHSDYSKRYKMLNFAAFRKYKTIEIRAFPSTLNEKEALSYFEFTLGAFRSYYNTRQQKRWLTIKSGTFRRTRPLIIKEKAPAIITDTN